MGIPLIDKFIIPESLFPLRKLFKITLFLNSLLKVDQIQTSNGLGLKSSIAKLNQHFELELINNFQDNE